jgi:hypothetical protein
MNSCSFPVTTTISSGEEKSIARRRVDWKRDAESKIFRNCFGNCPRERGKRRVPLPPARIRAFVFSSPSS